MNSVLGNHERAELVVGVIGGMGPEATADFYLKLLQITPASCDQEHLRVIIDSNGKVPDRVQAILGDGASPAPVLVAMARNLEAIGAELLVIPCNTAHHYIQEVRLGVSVPVLHMQEEVMLALKKLTVQDQAPKQVGLLATTATIAVALYQHEAAKHGITILSPESQAQEQLVMAGIRAVKAGDKVQGKMLLQEAADLLVAQGASAIIAGCTEVPLVLLPDAQAVPLIDATLILAQATLAAARPT